MTVVPTITLNNGVEIPQLGFGVFQIEPSETKAATLAALEVGYRHIDTAEMYGNEAEVGEAVRESGLDRGDVFVTSKLNNSFHAYDDALNAFEGTLKALDIDYVDLFLVHWPLPTVGDLRLVAVHLGGVDVPIADLDGRTHRGRRLGGRDLEDTEAELRDLDTVVEADVRYDGHVAPRLESVHVVRPLPNTHRATRNSVEPLGILPV